MAEYQGECIAYDELDLGVANLDVERIHACSLDLDHDIVVPQDRRRHLANRDLFLLSVLPYVGCAHRLRVALVHLLDSLSAQGAHGTLCRTRVRPESG